MKLLFKILLWFVLMYITEIVIGGIVIMAVAGVTALPYIRLIFFEGGALTVFVLNCLIYVINFSRSFIISKRAAEQTDRIPRSYFALLPTLVIDYLVIKLIYVIVRSKPINIGKEDLILMFVILLGFVLYYFTESRLERKKKITTNSAS